MGISCARCEPLLFCNRSQKDVEPSKVRVTACAIGVILLLIGFLSFCEGLGNSAGVGPNWTWGLVGILLIVGSSLRSKDNHTSTPSFDGVYPVHSSQQSPLNSPVTSTASDTNEDYHLAEKAREYAARSQVDEAFEAVRKIRDPSTKESWFAYLGQCYYYQGDADHVREIFKLVIFNAIAHKLAEKIVSLPLNRIVTPEKINQPDQRIDEFIDKIYPEATKFFANGQSGLAIQFVMLESFKNLDVQEVFK